MTNVLPEQRICVGQVRRNASWHWPCRHWCAVVAEDFHRLCTSRFVLTKFVATQLKVRYQRSTLGFLRGLLQRVLVLTVLAVVFSRVMRWEIRQYAVYLFSGMILWQFFAASIESGSRCLLRSEFLIRKVAVQKLLFP